MGNHSTIDNQIKAKCLAQFVIELQEEGSLFKCTNWKSMSRVLNKVHRRMVYKDAFGNTIRISRKMKNEFINTVANRYRLIDPDSFDRSIPVIKLMPDPC